jgi:hypothetical protein
VLPITESPKRWDWTSHLFGLSVIGNTTLQCDR